MPELINNGNDMKKLMIDIETLDTKPTAVILSIGAVVWDLEGTYDEFEVKIDLDSAIKAGLTISASTLKWWMMQGQKAKDSSFGGDIKINHAITDFKHFVRSHKIDEVWANSPSFDCIILRNAFDLFNIETPWAHYQERDVRTLSSLNPQIKRNTANVGTAHNALDDCYFQIAYCRELLSCPN